MPRQLSCGRRLPFRTRQSCVNAGPTRRTGCPDGHCRFGKIRIVESPCPNEDQVRPSLSLAEERSPAGWAESTVHSIATVRDTREVTRPPYDLEGRGAKASTNRSAACAQVLAIAAPAHPRRDWWLVALPANRAAKAPASHCHCALQGRNAGMLGTDHMPAPLARRRQCRLTLRCTPTCYGGELKR